MNKHSDLIARIEALGDSGSNELDVLVEVALFKPGQWVKAVRADNSGTKVIYTFLTVRAITTGSNETRTHTVSKDIAVQAMDWTSKRQRPATVNYLRTQEGLE